MSEKCDHLWLLAGHPKHILGSVFSAESCIKCDVIVTCRYSEAEWNGPEATARREQERLAAIAWWAAHPKMPTTKGNIMTETKTAVRLMGFCGSCCGTFHAMSDYPGVREHVIKAEKLPDNFVEDQVARRLQTREVAEQMAKNLQTETVFWDMPCPAKEPDGKPCLNGNVRFIKGWPGPDGWDNPNAFSMDRGWRPAPATRPRPVYLGVPEPPAEG